MKVTESNKVAVNHYEPQSYDATIEQAAELVAGLGDGYNLVIDVSASMTGYTKGMMDVLSGSNIRVIEVTNRVERDYIASSAQLIIPSNPNAGSTMKPAFDLVREKYNDKPTVLLTDGFIEPLNLTGLKEKVVIISNSHCPPIDTLNDCNDVVSVQIEIKSE